MGGVWGGCGQRPLFAESGNAGIGRETFCRRSRCRLDFSLCEWASVAKGIVGNRMTGFDNGWAIWPFAHGYFKGAVGCRRGCAGGGEVGGG